MFVACKIPGGLFVDHGGRRIVINGENTGIGVLDLVKNGEAPDSALRYHGWGITELQGDDAAAFTDWFAMSSKGHGPASNGTLEIFDKLADAQKEVKSRGSVKSGMEGADPDKDLKGVEKADNKE